MDRTLTIQDSHIEELIQYRYKDKLNKLGEEGKKEHDRADKIEEEFKKFKGERLYLVVKSYGYATDLDYSYRSVDHVTKELKEAKEEIVELKKKLAEETRLAGIRELIFTQEKKAKEEIAEFTYDVIIKHNNWMEEARRLLWYQKPKVTYQIELPYVLIEDKEEK